MRISAFVEVWFTLNRGRKLLLLGAALCALAVLAILVVVGNASWVAALPLALAALLGVMGPESEAPLVVTAGCVVGWALWMPREHAAGAWPLLAALLLLAYHVLISLAGHRPPASPVERAPLVRWGRRTALVAGATVGSWLLMLLFVGAPLAAPAWGRAVALLALGALLVWGARRLGADNRAD